MLRSVLVKVLIRQNAFVHIRWQVFIGCDCIKKFVVNYCFLLVWSFWIVYFLVPTATKFSLSQKSSASVIEIEMLL